MESISKANVCFGSEAEVTRARPARPFYANSGHSSLRTSKQKRPPTNAAFMERWKEALGN
jgi:hypothetical protein